MNNKQGEQKVRFDEDKLIVLGPSFDFWLNEEDDIYDELYAERETQTGRSLPDRRNFSGRPVDKKSASDSHRFQ